MLRTSLEQIGYAVTEHVNVATGQRWLEVT
jgi:hypothetical protein